MYIDLTKKYIEVNANYKPRKINDENQLIENSLEFLKVSSLIKHRLYSKEMPWIVSYLIFVSIRSNKRIF